MLAQRVIDHARPVWRPGVGDHHPRDGGVPGDADGELAVPAAGGVPDRVGPQFGRDDGQVAARRAGGQQCGEPFAQHGELAIFAGEGPLPAEFGHALEQSTAESRNARFLIELS